MYWKNANRRLAFAKMSSKKFLIALICVVRHRPATEHNVVTDWTTIASTTIVQNGNRSGCGECKRTGGKMREVATIEQIGRAHV